MGIGRAGSQEHRVGVPGQREDGRAQGLLEVFGNPPIVLLFEVADSDNAGSGADGELVLIGGPANVGSRTVDAEEDESGLPAGRRRLPDEGVTI
jgi:hypothetical protein